jgi:hypothetical protein
MLRSMEKEREERKKGEKYASRNTVPTKGTDAYK